MNTNEILSRMAAIEAMINEQRAAITTLMVQSSYINAAALTLMTLHPEAKKALAIYGNHHQAVCQQIADALAVKRMQSFLEGFRSEISGNQPPDPFQKN